MIEAVPDNDVRIGYDPADTRELQCHPLDHTIPCNVRVSESLDVHSEWVRRQFGETQERCTFLRTCKNMTVAVRGVVAGMLSGLLVEFICPEKHVGRTKLAHSVLSCR